MRKLEFRDPLAIAASSLKLSGLKSARNHRRASLRTGSRRRSNSFRLRVALSKGVDINACNMIRVGPANARAHLRADQIKSECAAFANPKTARLVQRSLAGRSRSRP